MLPLVLLIVLLDSNESHRQSPMIDRWMLLDYVSNRFDRQSSLDRRVNSLAVSNRRPLAITRFYTIGCKLYIAI